MSQTVITSTMTRGFAGMLDGMENTVASAFSEEASAEVPFGVGVARGTADDGVLLPATSTAKVRGVVVHDHAHALGQELGDTGLKPKTQFGVLRRGRILVIVEEAVVPGDRGYVRYSGSGQKGAWRMSAVAGETLDCTSQAEFQTTQATIGGLAVLDVDFTND